VTTFVIVPRTRAQRMVAQYVENAYRAPPG
jgi:hypothetical protein